MDVDVRRRRSRFRLSRARAQARLASVLLVGCVAALTVVNIVFSSQHALGSHLPDLVCLLALCAGAWLVRQDWLPDEAVPWLCSVIAVVIAEMMLAQTWRDPFNLGIFYALVVMVVYSSVVLHIPAAVGAGVVMLASYAAVASHVAPERLSDLMVLGVTALTVGGVIMWLRLVGFDSLSDSMAAAAALATNDPLTGLLNRRGFEARAQQLVADAARHGESVIVLFVDVDQMKGINDTHGHGVGDEVLIGTAEALRSATRASDVVARWGGDEFVVLATGSAAEPMKSRIVAAIESNASAVAPGRGVVTVGCAAASSGRLELAQLIEAADLDMYRQREARLSPSQPDPAP